MNLLIIVFMVTTFVLMTTAPRSTQDVEHVSAQNNQTTSQSTAKDSDV